MDHIKQSKFEIQPVIEQKPFENPAVQSFFAKWCEINDSIQPQIVDRDEWEKRGIKGILEKMPDGKQTLFIPEDLQLWEMVGVMEAVDHDTFTAKPERQREVKEKLLALAKTFQNAGTYIAQRIEKIHEGREIAEALASEFYEYGQSLVEGKMPKTPHGTDDIASSDLTPKEIEIVDCFLAGDSLYESKQKRVGLAIAGDPSKKDELYESERQKTLAQFFRVADEAFALKGKNTDGKLQEKTTQLRPWQNDAPIHSAFLVKIENAMRQKIETPKRELEMAIFRRGLEKLISEMRETVAMRDARINKMQKWSKWKVALNQFLTQCGFNAVAEQKKLADVLHISKLKTELETIRQTGNRAKISQKECEIADKIQNVVSNFPFKSGANNPAEIVANKYINCVGASMLGGALMKEAGLNYLVGDTPEHSILFLVTSDGKVEWRDMLNTTFNEKLTDEMIEEHRKDGVPLAIRDIVVFAHKPISEGLMFDIKKEDKRRHVTVFEPEQGHYIQVLYNTGVVLRSLGRDEEAIEAFQQAVAVDPKYAYPYIGLGNAFYQLGDYKKAIKAFQQAVAVDPKYAYPYYSLGVILSDLGRNKEAIQACGKFINLADEKKDDYFIRRAKQMITKLKK